MKLFFKEKTLPDGRIVNYHTISEVELDLSTNITTVILKSYTLESSAIQLKIPDATFSIIVPNNIIQTTPNYLENLDTYLNTLPDWQGISKYLDKSVPVITEINPSEQNAPQTDLMINIGVPTWLINNP
jgi:hypothetical protein